MMTTVGIPSRCLPPLCRASPHAAPHAYHASARVRGALRCMHSFTPLSRAVWALNSTQQQAYSGVRIDSSMSNIVSGGVGIALARI